MPKLIKGQDLTQEQKEQVLAKFTHRWTHENPHRVAVHGPCPFCDIKTPYVNTQTTNGHTHPTEPLVTDEEWMQAHAFWFNQNGKLTAAAFAEPAYLADDLTAQP